MKAVLITDLGSETELRDAAGNVTMILPRYGAWARCRRGSSHMEVIGTGALEELQKKFGPGLPVQRIPLDGALIAPLVT